MLDTNQHSELVIKLLGKVAFTDDEIKKVIAFKKGSKAKNYVRGYNACDGNTNQTAIAKIIGVTSGTLSPIMKQWEDAGIIFKYGKNYKKLRSV